jgi:hypothetical protein
LLSAAVPFEPAVCTVSGPPVVVLMVCAVALSGAHSSTAAAAAAVSRGTRRTWSPIAAPALPRALYIVDGEPT